MYDKAAAFLNSHITRVNTLEEVGQVLDEKWLCQDELVW